MDEVTTLGTSDRLEVLLIEDSSADAELLTELLRDQGNEPIGLTWVQTMAEGIERLGQEGFDTVLLDLGLGETEGLDTLEAFQDATPREIPIVVLTGLDDKEIAERAMHAGAQDYLVKGRSQAQDVLRAIRYAMARKLEQQGYEEALRRSIEIERLEDESAFKTRFLNLAAHELATPLTPVLFQLHALRDGHLGDLTPGQTRAVEVMDRGLGRLSRLIQDLLLVSRIQAEAPMLETHPTDLSAHLSTLTKRLDRRAQDRGVQLKLDVEPGLAAEVDRELFGQAIDRLLTAAVDHAQERATVAVGAARTPDGLHLEVRCPGISAGDAGDIFEPYARSIEVEGHQAEATGLSLYIARALIERHGGQLEAVPAKEGEGCVIQVHLPLEGTDPGTDDRDPVPSLG